MNNTDNEVKSNLKQQFRELFQDEPAPERLKHRVFGSLNRLSLLADLFDLFTAKLWQTKSQFLQIFEEKDHRKADQLPSEEETRQ